MNLTLSTGVAIALVVVAGLAVTVSLVVVGLCLASQRLPGARFDEHQAEADAIAGRLDEHVDQALAVVGELPTQPLHVVDVDEPTAPVIHLVQDDVLGGPVLRIGREP